MAKRWISREMFMESHQCPYISRSYAQFYPQAEFNDLMDLRPTFHGFPSTRRINNYFFY
jgi:hypothetical protein